ncbi:AAA family ATPase [Gordonia amicalis]|uniref:AAA family ATPase n=1 Tax=Gordonia amicalis TaxID=89053 RepID=UPI00295415EB|nr:AAA family ATPase [Gordonia amicalis]MDV7101998.1 AAA family ATPase [Gordonia amicalis]
MNQLVSSLPTKIELTRPILDLMSDDQPWSRVELRDALADALYLTPEQRAETVKSGGTRLHSRVSWALYQLKVSGAVDAAGPGKAKITAFGHQLLDEHPEQLTAADLEVSAQYLDDSSTVDDDSENLPVFWFVGAVFGDQLGDEAYDHTDQFRAEGRWHAGAPHKYAEQILTMKPGDRIAIKAAFTRKHGLPFDINGKTASAMSIKATGVITRNLGDGDGVEVEWNTDDLLPEEDWYFWTSRSTVWAVRPGTWKSKALIAFAFEGVEQDYDRFLTEPYWQKKYGLAAKPSRDHDDSSRGVEEVPDEPAYTVDDIVGEGCFSSVAELEGFVAALKRKKNLILQGPPGTGKTWLAKRLAYAIIERKDRQLIHALQFHPTVSYEDFVRGWRPSGDGKLTLTDGVFLDVIDAAVNEPDNNHVLVIEEINRANLAQVMGELLTLLEADKRKPSEALQLAYSRPDEEPVFIPENLFIIGTMNLADRSLAIVDFALRRRFAFADLSPQFNAAWQEWVYKRNGIDKTVLADLGARIGELNAQIADDRSLGAQYRIGHSFFTPSSEAPIIDAAAWIRGVVEQEIRPLLAEYWFDDPDRVVTETAKLIGTT